VRPAECAAGEAIKQEFKLHALLDCELENEQSVAACAAAACPEIVYHLAAQSSVRRSWEQPLATARANALGTLALLEAVRIHCPPPPSSWPARATASTMKPPAHTASRLRLPFASPIPTPASKVVAHQLNRLLSARTWFARGGGDFFQSFFAPPRRNVCRAWHCTQRCARQARPRPRNYHRLLGKRRATGRGSELMEAFAANGALDKPHDLVLASGRTRTVRDWVEEAQRQLDLDPALVAVDASRLHAGDRPHTFGNIELTNEVLGWSPRMGNQGDGRSAH